MFKRIINLITIILLGLLIFISVLVTFNFTKINRNLQIGTGFSETNPPRNNIMVIIDGTDPSYVEKMKEGVTKACQENEVAFEFWAISGEHREDDIIAQFDLGVESMVDGIIVQAFDDPRFDDIMGKANYRKIPVITIGEDIPSQEKLCFLSFNRYQIGSLLGKRINEQLNNSLVQSGTIVMLQSDQVTDNNQAVAINEEIDSKFTLKLEKVTYQGENILNSEGVVREIMNQYDDLVGVVCSSGVETLGVIQALKETNKLNDVLVIGFDDSAEIRDYIDRGVIYATIVADNERLGYEAVANMVAYYENQFVSMYQAINIRIITGENLYEYIDSLGEEDEKGNTVN